MVVKVRQCDDGVPLRTKGQELMLMATAVVTKVQQCDDGVLSTAIRSRRWERPQQLCKDSHLKERRRSCWRGFKSCFAQHSNMCRGYGGGVVRSLSSSCVELWHE